MKISSGGLLAVTLIFAACGKKPPPPTPPAEAPATQTLLQETVIPAAPPPSPPSPPGGTTDNSPSANPADDAPTVIAIQELNTALRNYVSAKGRFPSSIEELCKDPALAQKKFKLPAGKHFVIDQRGMQVTLSN